MLGKKTKVHTNNFCVPIPTFTFYSDISDLHVLLLNIMIAFLWLKE